MKRRSFFGLVGAGIGAGAATVLTDRLATASTNDASVAAEHGPVFRAAERPNGNAISVKFLKGDKSGLEQLWGFDRGFSERDVMWATKTVRGAAVVYGKYQLQITEESPVRLACGSFVGDGIDGKSNAIERIMRQLRSDLVRRLHAAGFPRPNKADRNAAWLRQNGVTTRAELVRKNYKWAAEHLKMQESYNYFHDSECEKQANWLRENIHRFCLSNTTVP